MTTDELSSREVQFFREVKKDVCKTMFGIDVVINALLVALVTRGHILLEGNPGLGKTALIKKISESLGFSESATGRIQFTPDLMPSDITGTKLPNDDGRLEFQKGPVFCQLLLADEINRATPKTQAAMLEAMAESQVTVLGQKYPLTKVKEVEDKNRLKVREPFLVMATQNPIDQEGTYSLPEAQLDRFLFKVRMPYPNSESMQLIIDKSLAEGIENFESQKSQQKSAEDKPLAMIHRLGQIIRSTEPSALVKQHILNIVMASNLEKINEVQAISDHELPQLKAFTSEQIEYGLGPRAGIFLTLATLGWAAISLVSESDPEPLSSKSLQALAQIAVPVLRHRMKFKLNYSEDYDESTSSEDWHDSLVREYISLCAPVNDGYRQNFDAALKSAQKEYFF